MWGGGGVGGDRFQAEEMPSESLYSRKNLEVFRKDQQGQCPGSSAKEGRANTGNWEGKARSGRASKAVVGEGRGRVHGASCLSPVIYTLH